VRVMGPESMARLASRNGVRRGGCTSGEHGTTRPSRRRGGTGGLGLNRRVLTHPNSATIYTQTVQQSPNKCSEQDGKHHCRRQMYDPTACNFSGNPSEQKMGNARSRSENPSQTLFSLPPLPGPVPVWWAPCLPRTLFERETTFSTHYVYLNRDFPALRQGSDCGFHRTLCYICMSTSVHGRAPLTRLLGLALFTQNPKSAFWFLDPRRLLNKLGLAG